MNHVVEQAGKGKWHGGELSESFGASSTSFLEALLMMIIVNIYRLYLRHIRVLSHSHIYEILNHLKYIYFTHMYTTCASRHSRLYEITHRHAHKHFHTDRYTYPRTYFLCLPLTWIFPERHAWIFQVKSPKIYNITPQQKLALIEKSFFFSWNLL